MEERRLRRGWKSLHGLTPFADRPTPLTKPAPQDPQEHSGLGKSRLNSNGSLIRQFFWEPVPSFNGYSSEMRTGPQFFPINQGRNWAHGYFNLGKVYSQLGKPSNAVHAFRQAVQVEPNFSDAHYQLGVTLRAQNRPAEAIVPLKAAAEGGNGGGPDSF